MLAALPGLFLSIAVNADFFCGKMREVIYRHSLFSLTSFSQTTACAIKKAILVVYAFISFMPVSFAPEKTVRTSHILFIVDDLLLKPYVLPGLKVL